MLTLESEHGHVFLEPAELSGAVLPLETLAARYLTGADAMTRASLLERLPTFLDGGKGQQTELAENLLKLRDILRSRLPSCKVDRADGCAATVDGLWRIDDCSYYVEGWVVHLAAGDVPPHCLDA